MLIKKNFGDCYWESYREAVSETAATLFRGYMDKNTHLDENTHNASEEEKSK